MHRQLDQPSTGPSCFPCCPPSDLSQVLQSAIERVINTPDDAEPSAEVPLGLYIVRGDNVCSVGLVDEELDASIDWSKVKGSVIGTTKHV